MKELAGLCAFTLFLGQAVYADGTLALSCLEGGTQTTEELSIPEIQELGVQSLETVTPWTDSHVFEGPFLRDVAALCGCDYEGALVTALNNYAAVIPEALVLEDDPILAYLRDGEPMDVAQKGPYWIIYDFGGNEAYGAAAYHNTSVWQVSSVSVGCR